MARHEGADLGYGLYKSIPGVGKVVIRARHISQVEVAALTNIDEEELEARYSRGGIHIWIGNFRLQKGKKVDGKKLFETVCTIRDYRFDADTYRGLGMDVQRETNRMP